MPTKCPTCHKNNPDDQKFCGDCGTKLGISPDSPPSITKTLKTPTKGVRIGATFAERYRIVDELGRGGMGVVYKAEDLRLERMVALKFLPPELTQDEEAKERFVLEARAAAAISHPNICTIHEIDEFEGQTYIAMEFVDGQSLRDLTKKGTIPVAETLDLAIQVAGGLEEAHKKGVIHRDIKSANILVTPSGQAKIMDFGLAKVSGGAMITQEGVTMGTVAYMSPEQARGEKVDSRTDIWSLGVVLYEILSVQLPFWGDKEASILYSIEHREHKPVRAFNPDIPAELVAIIDRCLKKKPDARYRSAGDIISELKRYQDSFRAEQAGFFNFKSLLRRLRQPKVAVPLAVIVVAVAAFIVWQLHRRSKIRWAREVALPEIEQFIEQNDLTSAYQLGLEAKKFIPKDQGLLETLEEISSPFYVATDPPGADVYMKDYRAEERPWTHLGQTPLEKIVIPGGFKQWRIEKPGYENFHGAVLIFSNELVHIKNSGWSVEVKLDNTGTYPPEMAHINAAHFSIPAANLNISDTLPLDAKPYGPTLSGLRHLERIALGEYLLDRHEVTNRDYKDFVDSGGYTNKHYWKHEFIRDGQTLPWDEAMEIFVDKSGRPGPASWELGEYPEGQGDYPVCGVSWYEAAAYAEYAGKSLPTVYHWNFATGIADSYIGQVAEYPFVIALSNFGRSGPMPVSESRALSSHGVYDLAGNVKEWCLNAEKDNHFILGGAWDDPPYMAIRTESFPPLFREHNFGFRCMKVLSGFEENFQTAASPVEPAPEPDFDQYQPCSDGEFRILKNYYAYTPTALEAEIQSTEEWGPDIILEEVSFNAAYGGERMIAYIFRPRETVAPLQVMIYYPGGGGRGLNSIHEYEIKG